MSLNKKFFIGGDSVVSTDYLFFVGDAGGQITNVRLNSIESEFTYSLPSSHSPWTGAFDPNNMYGGEGTLAESNKRFTKTNSNFYNNVFGDTVRNATEGNGKFYFELEFLNADLAFGITALSTAQNTFSTTFRQKSITMYSWTSNYQAYNTNYSNSSSLSTNDVIGIRVDFINLTFDYYKNNSHVVTVTIQNFT